MPELTELQGTDLVGQSRKPINENFINVASDFAGTAFPVNNVYEGMKCFRTDQNILYRYIGNVWKQELDLSGRTALIAEANHATQANNDSRNQQIDRTYIKNVTTKDGSIVVTKGDNSETTIPYNDNNDKVAVNPVPISNSNYAILVNKAGLENTTDGVQMDTSVTINPSEHSIQAAKFVGILDGNAKNDSRGQKIDETYLKDFNLSGVTVTVTKGDGTSKSFTVNTNFNSTNYFSGSTQGNRRMSGSFVVDNTDFTEGSGNVETRIFDTRSGIGAGTYTLASILQNLVNMSHWHRTGKSYSNCNCKCNCDCGDDGGP